jgi:hypothetical protein
MLSSILMFLGLVLCEPLDFSFPLCHRPLAKATTFPQCVIVGDKVPNVNY